MSGSARFVKSNLVYGSLGLAEDKFSPLVPAPSISHNNKLVKKKVSHTAMLLYLSCFIALFASSCQNCVCFK